MTLTGGYDGPENSEEKKRPPPQDSIWLIENVAQHDETSILCRLTIDDEPMGLFRLPSNDHLRFLRSRVQHDPSEEQKL